MYGRMITMRGTPISDMIIAGIGSSCAAAAAIGRSSSGLL